MTPNVGHTFKSGKDKAVIEIISRYGFKVAWTITADEYSLMVHGEYFGKGDVAHEDGISISPVDANTIMAFI